MVYEAVASGPRGLNGIAKGLPEEDMRRAGEFFPRR